MIDEIENRKKNIALLITTMIFMLTFALFPMPNFGVMLYGGKEVGMLPVPIAVFQGFMALLFFLIARYLLKVIFGFSWKKMKYFLIFGWPALLIAIYNVIFISDHTLFNYSIGTGLGGLTLAFVSALFIGFFEELIFRGGLLNSFLVLFNKHKNGPLLAILVSSVLFGIVHLMNFGWQGYWDTINQVISAVPAGIFFAVIYYKTKNLLIPVLLHAIIDTTDIFFKLYIDASVGIMHGLDWTTVAFSSIFLVVSWWMWKREDV
ncbi:CAAX amino terminal protease self- immunity [Listeria grayi]|uniref:Abortive infection protein n=1 Tax=Listeria grayi FSL F6-1183 TaxID=1265827 RepID=A0A829R9A4_LISGR|nr:type II CAAX endopeptidase family protein [Listeria grayi]EUJ28704.1 abortive infection protein [Listeria grayi FSL F6-1183]VEI36760.1 CAAX amino terminal protease self- immunity [Listeria grayi]